MISSTVLVTGANKGIGLQICRQLADLGFQVFLTARNEKAGRKAVQELQSDQRRVEFITLDVSDSTSVKEAAQRFKSYRADLDVLINNAGISIDKNAIVKMNIEILRQTLETNSIGPVRVIQEFLPFMKRGSRIINVSSGLGALSEMKAYAPAYSISKTMLNAITRQFSAALNEEGIVVNSMCPGWVRTDMGGEGADRPVEKGAETAVWLASEAPLKLNGQFFRDKQIIGW